MRIDDEMFRTLSCGEAESSVRRSSEEASTDIDEDVSLSGSEPPTSSPQVFRSRSALLGRRRQLRFRR